MTHRNALFESLTRFESLALPASPAHPPILVPVDAETALPDLALLENLLREHDRRTAENVLVLRNPEADVSELLAKLNAPVLPLNEAVPGWSSTAGYGNAVERRRRRTKLQKTSRRRNRR